MTDELHAGTGLTRNQFLIWLGQQTTPDLPVLNELTVVLIDGAIERSVFDRAFQTVIDSTDALRTVIHPVGGLPRTEVLDPLAFSSEFIDMSDEPDARETLDAWARRQVDSMLDLSRRPFDSTLVKLSDAQYAWAILHHHILSDATSLAIVVGNTGEVYRRMLAGEPLPSFESPSFEAYVEFEQAQAGSDRHGERKRYWESRTSNPPDQLSFYDGRVLGAENGLRRARLQLDLGLELSESLRRFANQRGIRLMSGDLSMFSVMAGAFLTFLHRLSGQDVIAIGVPWRNRRREFAETVGLMMEQDPLVVSIDEGETFASLNRKVQREAVGAMRHLPYAAGNPGGRVYDATFNYVKIPLTTFGDLAIDPRWYRPSFGSGSVDLQVHDLAGSGEITLSFDFNASLFDPAHRRAAVDHYLHCLTTLIEDPDQEVGSISLLTEGERALFDRWNETRRDHPLDRTIVELFEAQAADRPGSVAVRCEDDTLSYRALDERASTLARRLRAVDVGPGVLVGLCVDRSLDMLVGLLGILKAGGAYVPLDPTFPADRLEFMLTDSGAPVLVTETRLLGTVEPGQRQVVCIDAEADADAGIDRAPAASSRADDRSRATADDLAYVLYTSGSTGRPKGVEISNRALTNFLFAMRDEPGCTEDDVLLAVTTLSFDIAGLELYLPLLAGGQVEIATRTMAADGRRLRGRLDDGDITMLQASPATWRMMTDAGWDGTPGLKALIGGEALPPDLVPRLLKRTAALWNMYGPTETTIWSSVKQIETSDGEITVGRPIANTTFHILDEQQQPVPPGVAGELFIGGEGLARGYLGRPELTAEKFVDAPFGTEPAARLYRTGDLARFRSDGEVVHLGRLDDQIKIRGFRIEPGEIEAALAAHPGVHHSVVIARADRPGAEQLVAYCVRAGDDTPAPAALRQHLRQKLPDYMLPQQFVWLDALPLTPNGKIDRKELPPPNPGQVIPTGFVAPRSKVESQVATLVADVLQLPSVSVDADFFDLGGESLLAVSLMSQLEEVFGVQLPLHLLFESTTAAELSDRICDLTGAERAVTDTGTGVGGPGGARSVTERRLFGIWTDMLGSPVDSVDASFHDLDGTQELVPNMLAEVRQEFGVIAEGLSALDFEADPTIAGLASIIESRKAAASTFVVPLQPRGTRRPLFLIHAAGGYVFFYRALAARLGPDQPVYGLRAVTHEEDPGRSFDRSRSLEAVAAQYIREIKTVQSHGPYRLGGACVGGVIAFEMARQLVAAGEEIESPLLLFDSFLTAPWDSAPFYQMPGLVEQARTRVAEYLRPGDGPGQPSTAPTPAPTRGAVANLLSIWKLLPVAAHGAWWRAKLLRPVQGWRWRMARIRSRPASLEVAQQQTMEQFLETTLRLLRRYRPGRYPGSAVLFKAAQGDDPEPDWAPLVTGRLEIHTLPGAHLDMMEEPAVVATASLVSRYLRPEPVADDGGQTPDRRD